MPNEKEFDVKEIYTPLSVAKEEIWKRWNDKELRKKVDDFLGGDVPDFLTKEPKAYLARYVASPNFECLRFLELAKRAGLVPVIPEFKNDKYVVINPVKYFLANLRIENNKEDPEILKITDEDTANGTKFCNIKTLWGEDFMQFHHKIFQSSFDKNEKIIYDISEWFNHNGRKSDKFYAHFLALFIRNAILFENYLDSGEDGDLFRRVISPSFSNIEETFGCKPLIVRLLPRKSERDLYWYSYKTRIKSYIKGYGL